MGKKVGKNVAGVSVLWDVCDIEYQLGSQEEEYQVRINSFPSFPTYFLCESIMTLTLVSPPTVLLIEWKREERREKREERREKREERREPHTSVDVRRPQPAEKVLSGAGGGGWLQVWLQLGRLAWSPARLLERPGQQPPGLCRPVQRDRPGLVQVRRQSTTQRWARAGGEKERGQQQQDMKAVRGRVAVG